MPAAQLDVDLASGSAVAPDAAARALRVQIEDGRVLLSSRR